MTRWMPIDSISNFSRLNIVVCKILFFVMIALSILTALVPEVLLFNLIMS